MYHPIGGIIALGLAMTEYSLSDMTRNFLALSERTFKENRGGILSTIDPLNVFPAFFMAVRAWDSKYKTKPLREGLMSQFGSDMSMFPASTFTGSQRKVRVAVTSTTSGEPCIFTNYNRMISTGKYLVNQCDRPKLTSQLVQTVKTSNAKMNNQKKQRSGKRKSLTCMIYLTRRED